MGVLAFFSPTFPAEINAIFDSFGFGFYGQLINVNLRLSSSFELCLRARFSKPGKRAQGHRLEKEARQDHRKPEGQLVTFGDDLI